MHWIYAHLIGDYIIQSDWMAKGKKTSSFICLIHVITYLIPFLLTELEYWQIILIGIEHFIQDRTNIVVSSMKLTGSGLFAEKLAPWSIIITDNIYHILFMAWIASF